MGFVTESSMRTDYKMLFHETLKESMSIVAYITPKGILIEVVKEEMDSQSVDEGVIFDKLIEIRDDGVIDKLKNELKQRNSINTRR